MKLKKIVGIGVITISCAGMLTACSGHSDYNSDNNSTQTYAEAKESDNKTYKLAFFENRATDDTSNAYYTLGYYKNGSLVKKNLESDKDDYVEVIDPNIKTPFVTLKDNTYYIHRPPYSEYNQPLIKGKVTAKENG